MSMLRWGVTIPFWGISYRAEGAQFHIEEWPFRVESSFLSRERFVLSVPTSQKVSTCPFRGSIHKTTISNSLSRICPRFLPLPDNLSSQTNPRNPLLRSSARSAGATILRNPISSPPKSWAKKKSLTPNGIRLFKDWRRPTLPHFCSTIGANGLNFSVRDGKRWNPVAINT